MYQVLPASSEQWQVLKEVRLRALENAPDAFAFTLAQAQARTDDEWKQFATRWPAVRIAFLEESGEPCGMIGGAFCAPLGHEHDKAAELLAFWVAPEHRRRGIGHALVTAIVDWAVAHGTQELHARVAPGNAKALQFFKRLGFRRIEHAAPDENHLLLVSAEMIRKFTRHTAQALQKR